MCAYLVRPLASTRQGCSIPYLSCGTPVPHCCGFCHGSSTLQWTDANTMVDRFLKTVNFVPLHKLPLAGRLETGLSATFSASTAFIDSPFPTISHSLSPETGGLSAQLSAHQSGQTRQGECACHVPQRGIRLSAIQFFLHPALLSCYCLQLPSNSHCT